MASASARPDEILNPEARGGMACGAEAAVCVMVVPGMDLGGDHHHSVGTAQSLAVAGYGGARVA